MAAPVGMRMRMRIAADAMPSLSRKCAKFIHPFTSTITAAAKQTRLLHNTPLRPTSYKRFDDEKQSSPSSWSQWPAQSQQSSSREQLSPDAFRRQLEHQLFRRIGQVAQTQQQSQQFVQYKRFGGAGASGGGGGGRRRGWLSSRPPTLMLVALGGAGFYYVFHLEQVPETGRWRFIDVSAAQEHQMGQETFRQTLSEYRDHILPSSHPYSKQVRSVASRIVAALDKAVEDGNQPYHTKGDPNLTHHSHGEEGGIIYGSNTTIPGTGGQRDALFFGDQSNQVLNKPATNWEVFVIDDPKQKNAFVLPGGKIFVFTGILPICKNADGLATVLGHEVAHQVARHSAEKMSGYKVLLFGTFLLDAFGLDIGLSRAALTLLLSLPNSRKTELEADYLGLRIMSRACFDPREASQLWNRMSESEGGDNGQGVLNSAQAILSTHPVSSQRIKNMEKWLPEAIRTRQASNCPTPQQITGFTSAVHSAKQSFTPFS
ncbi:related to OMA1 - Metalloendopeptidase of the mitochondrial inner membrane [Melanopsichium pennsylvanicum]|uniref:Related to OMA1 - Metalloendopeptidase of the mitochondrial inner membrane n=2 Tax=Melanopsichium pennsylvanicum TaxID=63383 RepID=A0AAJ5C3W8_9BASI|nr:related to OMA1 - Metalloendopeptidase of the mitochondrial inner membrane [Melanopsichium pennsylvanicum]